MPRLRKRGHTVRLPDRPVNELTDAELEEAAHEARQEHLATGNVWRWLRRSGEIRAEQRMRARRNASCPV